MKPFQFSIAAVLLSTQLFQHSILAQGNLTPSGPPAPTMKTLQQVEPRTPISSLPFLATSSGSYYLTGNLTNASGPGYGIKISASDVTVDLNGFTMFGGASSGAGILVDDALHNVTLANGTVRNWSQYGVNAYRAFGVSCWRIRALGNFAGGFGLSSNGVARECLAHDNGYYGIYATSGSVVEECSIANNGGDGIQAENNCRLMNNYLSGNNTNLQNGSAAIYITGVGCRVEGNHVVGNLLKGMADFAGGNTFIHNTARANPAGNYSVTPLSALGPLITTSGVITNLNPWANFSF